MPSEQYEKNKHQMIKWRANNREKLNAKHREYSATYYDLNREKLKAKHREYSLKYSQYLRISKIFRHILL
jgi:hypothetical protein